MATTRSEVFLESLGLRPGAQLRLDQLPFSRQDATAGSEDELQAVVVGASDHCDLPLSIRESRFFRNIARRSASGEAPRRTLLQLEAFLADTRGVWENSWIRFPESRLSQHARYVFEADLQVARNGKVAARSDSERFRFTQNGETLLRIPISYVLKLSLADVVGRQPHMPVAMREEAGRLMRHFLNDNTSPETTSFYIVAADAKRSLGAQVAREAARRFLFTSLLISWANRRFGLIENGQRALVYHAPVPSVHQDELSSCIPDSFYRELFMSPCLSGWSDGEEKYQYMHLCHQVLSRSQLNAVVKLRDAGIIANDLIVLPNLSNVSLANNGIHISMGSRALGRQLQARDGFFPEDEKRIGDLAAKIYEHFLALFVGTYTAAPYRVGFNQFHPERLLSFLPHELDFTHLRLLWREWKEKANLSLCGRPQTPYGPQWLDRIVAKLFNLRGDCIPDARLLTYVHRDSRNRFLRTILQNCKKTRPSRRHPGYFRVSVRDYRRALLAYIQQTSGDLVEAAHMEETLADLAARCQDNEQEAGQRLLREIVGGRARDAMHIEAREFNRTAEDFYREGLRRRQLQEALAHLREDIAEAEGTGDQEMKISMRYGVRIQDPARFLDDVETRVLNDELSPHETSALLNLLLLLTERSRTRMEAMLA